ncbi:hypothetical protein JW899_04735 [Candidatus Uhrbacteria bacterium]|nr:hypothetical protein [Candidatus Uhrbacteria bacterium]
MEKGFRNELSSQKDNPADENTPETKEELVSKATQAPQGEVGEREPVRQNREDAEERPSDKWQLPYDPFEPAEMMGEILSARPEEAGLSAQERRQRRKERLSEFKEALARQKAGIAEIIDDLFKVVLATPDEKAESLMARVLDAAPKYRIGRSQLELFESAIREFRRKHEAVVKYRELYPDDADLFEACFGKKPDGRIDVTVRPMALLFQCFDKNDLAFAFGFHLHGGDQSKIDRQYVDFIRHSVGMALLRAGKIGDLFGAMIVKNGELFAEFDSQFGAPSVLSHEEQHQFNDLFEPNQKLLDVHETMRRMAEHGTPPKEAIRAIIRRLARWSRARMIDPEVRQEILAHYRQGIDTKTIGRTLVNLKLYDFRNDEYFRSRIDTLPLIIKNLLDREIQRVFRQTAENGGRTADTQGINIDESEIKNVVDSVFDEYPADMQNWLEAVETMERKGYGKDEIIGLLYQESIDRWPNLSKRMPDKNIDKNIGESK